MTAVLLYKRVPAVLVLSWWCPQSISPDGSWYKDSFDKLAV